MPNRWYATRGAVIDAGRQYGEELTATAVDRAIRSASAQIERILRRTFIPITDEKLYRWPRRLNHRALELELNFDVLAVTQLQTQAQDSSPTTISSDDYFLEPQQWGPPYRIIEIDLSSTAAFEAGDTPQRSISVTGRWGYSEDTESAGTVSSGLASDSSATSMVCSDGSLIDVGDTLLIESEQVFVIAKTSNDSGEDLTGNPTAQMNDQSIGVDDGTTFNAGEIILVNSERMRIDSISGNTLQVTRAVEGTVLAAHSSGDDVYVFRALTIERGDNGTTAATHANSTAISRYVAPGDVESLCVALALAQLLQERAGYGRATGGEASQELNERALGKLWDRVRGTLQKPRFATT